MTRSGRFGRVLGPSLFALIVQALQILIGIASVPLLIHELGTQRFSAFSILWSLPSLAPLVDLGMPRAMATLIVQPGGDGRRHEGEILAVAVLGQLVVLVALAVLFVALASSGVALAGAGAIPGEPGAGPGLLGKFLFASACLALINLFATFFQARGELYSLLTLTSFASLAVSLIPLTAAVSSPTLSDLGNDTVAVRVVSLAVAVLLLLPRRKEIFARMAPASMRRLVRPLAVGSSKSLPYFALSPILVFGERYIVSGLGGGLQIAAHLIAVDLGLRFLVVPGIIGQYSFRAIADSGSTERKYDRASLGYVDLMGWLYVLPLLGAICFSRELLRLWLGAERAAVVPIECVQFVLVAVTTCAVSSFLVQACLAAGEIRRLSRLVCLEAVVYPLCVWLILSHRGDLVALPVLLSALWSLRVIVEAALMIALTRDLFATRMMDWTALLFTGVPLACAAAVILVDRLGPSVPVKAALLVALSGVLIASLAKVKTYAKQAR